MVISWRKLTSRLTARLVWKETTRTPLTIDALTSKKSFKKQKANSLSVLSLLGYAKDVGRRIVQYEKAETS
jgi:hypothetical protein